MENSFNNRDFEKYLKQNSDQYRMFPSEKVWKNIHNALHTRRRWYGIGLALLLLTTATVTGVMLVPGNKSNGIAKQTGSRAVLAIPATKPSSEIAETNLLQPAPERTEPFTETFTRNTQPTQVVQLVQNDPLTDGSAIAYNESSVTVPVTIPVQRMQNNSERINKSTAAEKKDPVIFANIPVIAENKIQAPPVAEDTKSDKKELTPFPLTIESVVNSYTHHSNKKKWSWQLYVTPTISYRKLSENTAFISATRYNSIINGGPGAVSPSYYTTDVNSVVNHKPDAGFKLGVTASYPLSNWLRFTAGLQFGVSKYDIKAYDHSAEVATIALTSRNTVSTVTNYRNGNGYRENWLRNFYFAASLPIGLELKLSDGNRNYFGVASTLQPTYVLDNRAWLISTDYKNYAEVPSLTRRMNLNTSFEVFSVFTTGKVKWRVAPQVNYQLMSSFVKNYPIKEHLFDFGLKLGIQLK